MNRLFIIFVFLLFIGVASADSERSVNVKFGEGVVLKQLIISETYLISVKFKMEGNNSLRVSKAGTSCSCIDIIEYPEVLENDSKLLLLMKVDKILDFRYSIDITLSDGSKKVVNLIGSSRKKDSVDLSSTDGIDRLKGLNHSLMKGTARAFDKTLYISTKDLLNQDGVFSKEYKVVDIRPAKYRKEVVIPNALVLSRMELLTSSYLKNYNVVLVGRGLLSISEEKLCRKLNTYGFKAKLLFGGVPALENTGYKLDSTLLGKQNMFVISPLEVFLARSFSNVKFIGVEKDKKAARFLFNKFITKSSVTLRPWTQQVSLRDNEEKSGFILEGGLEAYLRFLRQQKRLQNPSKVTLKSSKGKTRRISAKDCKTCP